MIYTALKRNAVQTITIFSLIICAWTTHAFEPLTAMTTTETDYFIPPNMHTPEGTLPPGIMITIHAVDDPEGFIVISFDSSSGGTVKGVVTKDRIEPSFYATPEPLPVIEDTPTPAVTPTPEPTPTPLPPGASKTKTTQRTPAYHLQNPQRIIGYFPPEVEITILSNGPAATVYVLYNTDQGRIIHALCKAADLNAATPDLAQDRTATGRSPFPSRSSDDDTNRWYEDYDGWKEALSLQRKTKQKLLLYFYSDWSQDKEVLEDELLMTEDFLRESPDIIKVKINPGHSKFEARLAKKYSLSAVPSVFIVDKPSGEPRRVRLLRKMYGNVKTLDLQKALIELRTEPPPKKD
jgi:hypothetical protein